MHALRSHAGKYVRQRLLRLWTSRGGGFYGFVAVLYFLYLEVVDIGGDVSRAHALRLDLGSAISAVADYFVDALVNGVMAAIWPVHWIGTFGVSILSGVLLAGAYGTYRLIRPSVTRMLGGDPLTAAKAVPRLEV